MSRKSADDDDGMAEVDVENGSSGWDNHHSPAKNDSTAPEHSSDVPSTSMQVRRGSAILDSAAHSADSAGGVPRYRHGR